MRADKIARIFQVDTANLYLTDSTNVAVFPLDNGDFCSVDLDDRGHYEVHGGERPALATPQRSFAFMQAPSSSPQAFNFTPPPRASTLRSYQRFMLLEAEFKEIPCCGKSCIQAVAAEEGSNEPIC
ncbi:hypothetical protein R3I93_018351 [Phoxinus phoxinus]|uniref:Uncharacterized protein n=1 Tax=Phoxinus phoxinus TaxID=58324 RepID=A0AAN9GUM5_9TELE